MREAAKRKNDQKILIHIEDKDCVALEVKYHRRCYSSYTSFLRHVTTTQYQNILPYDSRLYAKSFDIFCEKFIRPKIIEKEKIYYMKAIKEKFVQTVKQVEDCDASSYRTFRLKERLIEMFPQLVFHTPKKRNKSEIVYVEDISQGSVAESYLEETEMPMTESDDNSEEESDFEILNPGFRFCEKSASLREIYSVALTLRERVINTPTKWYDQWPPLSSDMSGNKERKVVPPLLFNFVAWMLGFSTDPEEATFVDVDERVSPKLFSVCQDLIFIGSRGKYQTPKSLALATAVRQMSGCSGLITVLNGLGHCVSLSSTMSLDTALAQLAIDTATVVPREFVAGKFINLVFDNIDFGEEVAKQTHVTNGIIIQKLSEEEHGIGHNVQIAKSQRSVNMPNTDVTPYAIGARKTPKFHEVALNEKFNTSRENAEKIDFAYVIIKYVAKDEILLPGWSGFNTMLYHNNIPKESRVGYLPIIDASPTEYATINAILKTSMKIADKMQLQYAVLVFDEAVYAKVQQVRWKAKVYYDRFVVRLGEFHAIMSYLSAISKLYADAGLRVSILSVK